MTAEPAAGTQRALFWGTNVTFEDVRRDCQSFLTEYRRADGDDSSPAFYPELLRSLLMRQERNLNLSGRNLHSFSPKLYRNLVAYPSHVIPIMELAANDLAKEESAAEGGGGEVRVQVRPFDLLESRSLRDLGPEDIDRLVSVRGMVIRASSVIPTMRSASFRCGQCGRMEAVEVDLRDQLSQQPGQCPACGSRIPGMSLLHNRSVFEDKQVVRVQETPESIPEGMTPQSLSVVVFDSLVDAVKPGDRVELTGVFRAEPARDHPSKRTVHTLYRTFLDAVHFRKTEFKKRTGDFTAHDDGEDGDTLESRRRENEEELIRLSRLPDIYDRLTRSLAPSVWELDDVKRGLLCQLFGGTDKEVSATGHKFRGEINILLCGDPGTSKSQLLSFVHRIAPRGVYTSGKGSSAVGLTAFVARDADTGESVLESGALVLSDKGICCIDEFDKMTDFTRAVLHEVMEQQTVSIAKSGVVCSLNARTAVLASANPRESRYNPQLSVVENIQLPPTLLSRFDLIYLVLDKPNEATDKKLGDHIVAMFAAADGDGPRSGADGADYVIPADKLAAYVHHARTHCRPKLSDEAKLELVKGYVEMRKVGGNKKTITATPRQLESLIRTSEALAKMRLSESVTREDVLESIRLVRGAIQQAAIDPRTGTIDMDLINTGRSAVDRKMTEGLARALRDVMASGSGSRWDARSLLDAVRKQSEVTVSQNEVQDALAVLQQEGVIEMGAGYTVLRVTSSSQSPSL